MSPSCSPRPRSSSVTLGDDGVLVIDWSPEVLDFEATDDEKVLALAAILRTFGQFDEVKKVKFTVGGKAEGTANGKDIEDFWGRISLIGQPWDVLRAPVEPGSDETTGTGEATSTPEGSSTTG